MDLTKICKSLLQPRQLNESLPAQAASPGSLLPSAFHMESIPTHTLEISAAPRSAQTCKSTKEIGNCCCDEGKGAETAAPLFWDYEI